MTTDGWSAFSVKTRTTSKQQSRLKPIAMDEPTNHLDIGSIEALQRMLAGFPGALLLVSHDRDLIDSATGVVWSIEATDGGDAPTKTLRLE